MSREKKTDQKIKDILILVRVAKRLAISLLHHHNVKPFVVKVRGVSQKLGEDYQTFTRKTPFDNCVKLRYRDTLKSRIISAYEDTRQNCI